MSLGNTVYVGLAIASLAYPPGNTRLFRSAISLVSFCLGAFIFARFHRIFSPKRRWVLCVSFAAQALLIITAACIVTWLPGSLESDAEGWGAHIVVPLILISFQSAGQAVSSRALKYNGLTSVVLTSVYCDLFSDADLFALRNVERNRRVAAPLLLLIGAIGGGIFVHSFVGMMGALWLAAGMKAIMVVTWFVWRAEDDEMV